MSRKIDERRQLAELHARYVQSAASVEQKYKALLVDDFDEDDDFSSLGNDGEEEEELTDEQIARQIADAAMLLRRQDVAAPPPAPGAGTKDNPFSIVDIVTFCEHDYYLGLRLTPWQELILKTFYMGTAGNSHLKIEEERPETGCKSCVWSKNLECELEHAKTRKFKGYKSKLLVEGPENSRCLFCTRFDPALREDRFNEMADNALQNEAGDVVRKEVSEYRERNIVDNFQNQMDLIMGMRGGVEDENYSINPTVRDQILEKKAWKFQELVLVLGRRSGKALALNTPIRTTAGWKTMLELSIGDQVFGPNGLPTNVVWKSEIIKDEDSYELTFSNGEKIVAGASHDWVTYTKAERKNAGRGIHSKEPKAQKFTTEQIYHTLYSGKPRYLKNKGRDTVRIKATRESNHAIRVTAPLQYVEPQELPIHPYLLGVYLGDGCKTNGIISTADIDCIEYIRSCGYRVTKVKTAQYGWRVRENSKGIPFITILKSKGLTNTKHIPESYLQASVEQRLELLRGLLDSDGYCDPSKHTVEFCNTNETLARQVYELCCSLGFKTTFNTGDATLHGRLISKSYRVCFMPTTGVRVFNLERKHQNQAVKNKSDINYIFIRDVKKLDSPVPLQCIQVDNESHCYLAGKSLVTTHNSFLVSIIALYEAYKFIMMGHPQSYYPLKQWDEIMILNVALSEKQAKFAIFNKLREDVLASPWFGPHVGKVTQTDMFLLTPADKEENKRRQKTGTPLIVGSIHIKSGNSNSASQLGGTIAVIIVDEMAAMARESSDGDATDELLYTLLKPSIATFGFDGKIICISNPLGPFGKFYKLYETGIKDKLTLVHQLPTWLANPSIQKDFIDSERLKDPNAFAMQYAAKFGGGGDDAWLPAEFVRAALPTEADPNRRRREHGEPLYRYYMHLDPAYSSDNYTLCILHAEEIHGATNTDGSPVSKIVVDHLHYWKPMGKNQPINVEEVEKYVLDVGRRFRVTKITYDQHWSSQSSVVKFTRAGFRCEMTPYVFQYQNLIYGELYDLFTSYRIEFYHVNTTYNGVNMGEIGMAQKEFSNLQKKWRHGKPKIEASMGNHDDFADCIAGAAYQAIKDKDFKSLAKPRLGRIGVPNQNGWLSRTSYGNRW